MSIRVLHLGTEKTWRGGENQIRLLIDGLAYKVDAQFAASPRNSVAYKEKRWKCEILPLIGSNPYNPINILKLLQFIKKNRINLIDAHTAKAHTLALNVLRFLPDVRLVVHRRVDNVPKANYLTKKKYFHHRVDRFIAISNFIKQVLLDYGVSENRISIARSAVSDEAYQKISRPFCQNDLKNRYAIPADATVIGNASALSTQKGHETLLRAVAELKKKTQNFRVLIAGDGDLKTDLQKLAEELQVQDFVRFTGFIQKVPDFLSGLDILAVPSNNEGLGTVILDGVLAGCAVTASRVGGIPEIIIDNQTGLLCEVGDYKKLADNLLELIQDPAKAEKLRIAAQQWVKKEFSLESMVEGNYKIYRDVLRK
jgi:glycosyltransferase involved in cell wall biosynthesis